jgi:uncharacterized protein
MTIPELLRSSKTIAIVGLSDRPEASSNGVARQLVRRGFLVIPVNPRLKEWNGVQAYPNVSSIPDNVEIDIVDIFRRAEETPDIVRDILKRNAKPRAIWLQLGIRNAEAKQLTEQAGIFYVEDRCVGVESALANIKVE